ncbi:MAG: extracellular solute-binding protein, partial [Ruminiclostridium sp.]
YLKNDPDWKSEFIPDALNDVTYDGSIYGAPFQMLTCGNIFYNKAIFAEAGYSEFPKTWDEYIDCLTKIKGLGYTPISLGNKGLWVANSCYFGTLGDRTATDSWFKGIMANSGAKFTDPDIVLAVEKLQQLEKLGAFNTDMNSIDNSQQRTAFYKGKAASFFEGNWAISDMIVNCPKEILDNTEIALLPTIPGSKGAGDRVAGGSAWGNAYAASLEGAKRDAAVLFLKYSTDNAYGADLLDAGDFPGVKVPDYDLNKLNPFAKKYYNLRNTWTMAPQYDCQFDTSVIDAMNVGFQNILTNQITPKQWGESVQAEYEKSVK